jgi:hypothetical protein
MWKIQNIQKIRPCVEAQPDARALVFFPEIPEFPEFPAIPIAMRP